MVQQVLTDFGLTKNEAEVYLFLSKNGASSSRQVAVLLKKDKAQVLRLMKSLQRKGLAESTLELPKRFMAASFEQVLDMFVKAKKDQAKQLEDTKKDLLLYWKSVDKKNKDVSSDRFVVIEGNNNIYSKIAHMLSEAKKELSAVSTVPRLLRADESGVFDNLKSNPLHRGLNLRFLAELSNENQVSINVLLERASIAGINIKAKNPVQGSNLSPLMMLRDNEEILLFINPQENDAIKPQSDLALLTNCKTIVQTFSAVFESLWQKSTDIQPDKSFLSCGKPPKTFIRDHSTKSISKKYADIIDSAKEKVIIATSSNGVVDLWKNSNCLKVPMEKGIRIKIMTQTTVENLPVIQQLTKACEVKHIPKSRIRTAIIDGKYIFQLHNLEAAYDGDGDRFAFNFYTDDPEFVRRNEEVLEELWANAQPASAMPLESILNLADDSLNYLQEPKVYTPPFARMSFQVQEIQQGTITEKDVINKVLNAKRITAKDSYKDMNTLCGSNAWAVIHPPEAFQLPDMLINVWHCDKQSSWGAEDWMIIHLWLETVLGKKYVPVAHVTDNPEASEFRKGVYANTPAAKNCQLLSKDQFHIQVHGNILFAGWTIPVPLSPTPYVLPPSCLTVEGYGEPRTTVVRTQAPSGRTQITEANSFDASVTFCTPESNYSGAGTDGIFNREVFFTAYPPATPKL
jgi:sugar-specific transcriptional regulator TrmB